MMHHIVEAISVPAMLVSADGRIEASNASARQIFGEAISGRHYITVLRQPTLLDAVESALAKRRITTALYLTTEARRDITLQATCTPVSDSGGVLICLEDRTAMEEAGEMRRDFVANVSHELRTPLTALMGFIETLRGAARDDTAARDRFLEIMGREAGRMNRLVGDLLSLSKVEANERVRPKSSVDLAAIVRSVLASLTPVADEAGVALSTDGLDDRQSVTGDDDELAQVVTNLVENAIKYAGQGARVDIRLYRDAHNKAVLGPALCLEVRDFGEGIEARHLPRLTERFYRIDSHRSREMGGTGLGLAIVKHIVNRHRGRLRIESSVGIGSTFTVILPAAEDKIS